jgi:hypothetical protein
MAIAMTIGASKIRLLQESALASMQEKKAMDSRLQKEGTLSKSQEREPT